MSHLSPRAEKARQAAGAHRAAYLPIIARTSKQTIIKRPACNSRSFQRDFFQAIKDSLPTFDYDSRRGWWVGSLDALPFAVETLKAAYHDVVLSDGARAILEDDAQKTFVTLEYSHKGYRAPDDAQAYGIECRVIQTNDPTQTSVTRELADVRQELELDGYTLQSAHAVSFSQFGRYFPRWRETWTR